ncbi:helix-turn-helix transcriptional regulator [Saccharopolyspora thermophila]|uniref:HTH cro/C1-type domain-containing protein n=1 Tax=Saccharopolyspora thermophila TaxID=89367 RepID=A0ABP3M858_9PSEU
MQADELAGKSIGERLQVIRERTGKSRAVVAGLVGRSPDWLKQVEKGKIQTPRLPTLVRLAEALGVRDLAEITGSASVPVDLNRRAGHPAVEALREAIEEMPLTAGTSAPPNVAALKQSTDYAWNLWHNSPTPRSAAGALLPGIIRDARRAARTLDGKPRRSAYATLTSAYALAHQVLAWVSDTPLLWLVADRAINAAAHAGEPESMALGAWVLGNVWRATGREEDAYRLVTEAAALLSVIPVE